MIANLFEFATTVAVMFTMAVYRGWIIAHFWAWFIMPTFPVKALSIPVALGISVFMAILTHTPRARTPGVQQTVIESFFVGISRNTIFFGIGYIIARFV